MQFPDRGIREKEISTAEGHCLEHNKLDINYTSYYQCYYWLCTTPKQQAFLANLIKARPLVGT